MFNKGCFFECHEVLEQFYQKTEDTNKPFLEGLIQLAAAFRIFSDFGETRGAVRMIRQALIRFEPYQPSFLQVRVEELCTAMEAWAQLAESADRSVSISSIPKIQTQLFNFLP